jgi:hypothetical protein
MRLALGLGTRPTNPGQTPSTSSPPPASHDSGRQRRRFAQDGDVPVVMLHRGRDSEPGGENKLAALTADLREERAARLKSDRALDEANLLINSLKTKLKHTEMTLEETLRREGEARAQLDALLVTEREARQQAETRAAEAALAVTVLERKIEAAAAAAKTAAPAPVAPVAVPPTPDLFGEETAPPVASASPKRRPGRKAAAQDEPAPAAVAPHPQRAEEDEDDKPIEWWLPSFRAARKTPVRRKRATG